MADTREKLIELIQAAKSKKQYDFLFGNIDDAIDLKSDEEYIADHLIANGVTLATDNNVGDKWIPVTERLPEAEEYIYSVDVLFLDANGTVRVGYVNLVTGDWKTQEARWKIGKEKVTHWMPLPEPPKRE